MRYLSVPLFIDRNGRPSLLLTATRKVITIDSLDYYRTVTW